MLRIFLFILAIAGLCACESVNLESIGVDETDNAALCITAHAEPAWSASRAEYRRVELPQGVQLSPEQLAALLEACR